MANLLTMDWKKLLVELKVNFKCVLLIALVSTDDTVSR